MSENRTHGVTITATAAICVIGIGLAAALVAGFVHEDNNKARKRQHEGHEAMHAEADKALWATQVLDIIVFQDNGEVSLAVGMRDGWVRYKNLLYLDQTSEARPIPGLVIRHPRVVKRGSLEYEQVLSKHLAGR